MFEPPVFGTDGLRGHAGAPPMDPETLRRVGAALGVWLQKQGPLQKRVLLGNDGRQSALWIMDALAQGLLATDVSVHDAGLLTTPALAFLCRTEHFVAGIMISASHNPADDNGIKIFAGDGTKMSDAAEQEIAALTEGMDFKSSPTPRIKTRSELRARYEEHLVNLFGHLDLTGMRLVFDGANGGGSQIGPTVLQGLGAEVHAIACEPDGDNINDGVGALHTGHLAAAVASFGADFGISLDGDGDRGMFVDRSATLHDGDSVLAFLGPRMQAAGTLPHDTVAATVMSNIGLSAVLSKHGIKIHTTPVGDRAVVQAMREHGYGLGGEQSGHVIFAGDGALTGDGLFTALRLLSEPSLRRDSAEALAAFRRFPQRLINIPVRHKPELGTLPAVQREQDRAERDLGNSGRVLLRYSGTENLCRVMVEGPEDAVVNELAERLAAVVRQEIGA